MHLHTQEHSLHPGLPFLPSQSPVEEESQLKSVVLLAHYVIVLIQVVQHGETLLFVKPNGSIVVVYHMQGYYLYLRSCPQKGNCVIEQPLRQPSAPHLINHAQRHNVGRVVLKRQQALQPPYLQIFLLDPQLKDDSPHNSCVILRVFPHSDYCLSYKTDSRSTLNPIVEVVTIIQGKPLSLQLSQLRVVFFPVLSNARFRSLVLLQMPSQELVNVTMQDRTFLLRVG